MKEKIIKILEEKAECTINGHADFDNVDVTQFEGIAEEIVKLCNLHFITQRSELLMACLNKLNELGYNLDFEYDEETCNEVVKAINCG